MPIVAALAALLMLVIRAGIAGFIGWSVLEHRDTVSDAVAGTIVAGGAAAGGAATAVAGAGQGFGDLARNAPLWLIGGLAALLVIGRR